MKQFFTAACLAFTATVVAPSCAKEDQPGDDNYTLSGIGNGWQQVPPNSSQAVANISGTYNPNSNSLQYNIVWTGLSGAVTEAHFHGSAAPGIAAEALYGINVVINDVSGRAAGEITVADSVEAALLQGRIYYDIHTTAYPLGELRGQVTLMPDTTGK